MRESENRVKMNPVVLTLFIRAISIMFLISGFSTRSDMLKNITMAGKCVYMR